MASLEVFVEKSDRIIAIDLKIGIGSHLLKAIKVKLAGKAGKIGMIEIFWHDFFFKSLNVLDSEAVTGSRPGCNGWVTIIDHVKCFYTREKRATKPS